MNSTEEPRSGLLSHLAELRSRLIHGAIAVVLVFIPLAIFSDPLFTWLAAPLVQQLSGGNQMIATQVATPFLIPFKFAFIVAVMICIPYLLHQIWAFIAPGLYQNERRFAVPLLISSVLLFYVGVAFAYFLVFPAVFGFFAHTAPAGVAVMTDISHYLDFALALFFAFGLTFEVPVLTVLLVWAGITTPAALRRQRGYVLIGIFVVAMLLTPPDVFSQTLLAIPMYALYEAGILLARWLVPGSREVEAEHDGAA